MSTVDISSNPNLNFTPIRFDLGAPTNSAQSGQLTPVAQQAVYSKPSNNSGSVLGTSTSNSASVVKEGANSGSVKPAANNNPPGDSEITQLQKMDRNPSQEARYQQLLREMQSQQVDPRIMDEANNQYNNAMSFANQVEQTLRGQQSGLNDQITRTGDQNQGLIDSTYQQGISSLASEQDLVGKRQNNFIDAARQTLSESNLGNSQRFGSNAQITKALGEYGTTKFQQATGQAYQTAQEAYTKIVQQKQVLEQNYANSKIQIKNWVAENIANTQREFENKLLEIAQLRNSAESDRSNLRIQALNNVQQTINAVKMQAIQFEQSLYAQAVQHAQNLETQQAALTSGIKAFTNDSAANTTTALGGLQTNLQQSIPNANQGTTGSSLQGFTQNLMGAINPFKSKNTADQISYK